MPVPVPVHSKQPAHPVIKKYHIDDGHSNPFFTLTCSLPVAPTGPPPSFGTREQWINSLPSWRRTKPRRIWEEDSRLVGRCAEQDFSQGLAVAANASVIKGAHAEACIPPLFNFIQSPALHTSSTDGDADDEMSSEGSTVSQCHSGSQWGDGSPSARSKMNDPPASYERGAFSPIFEEPSPEDNSGSSPIGPATPFADFVDRAVAADGYDGEYGVPAISTDDIPYGINKCDYDYYQPLPSVVEEPKEPVLAPEVVTPSASVGYKKLAEPLSEWIANYVWKTCTTESAFPFRGTPPTFSRQYSRAPPEYLASLIHSLLLSTLLQPSAIFLALWYIVRLPVSFGTILISNEDVKELRFRAALLGTDHGHNQEMMEASAPFRLAVLGCMLANKWLDDHTFSNKTWHTISNVPIHALNHLEFLALDIFGYDLSITNEHWSQWLSHVMSYHLSLSSSHPQPISRPSANPHSIIRKAIDGIIQAPAVCNFDPSHPQPVFMGLEERRREKLEREHAMAVELAEFDIDEGGPLREEYIPKRRISGASSTYSTGSRENDSHVSSGWDRRNVQSVKGLPPPAKWSPAADEPILRDRNRGGAQYIAVQPPRLNAVPYHLIPAYPQCHEVGYQGHHWPMGGAYVQPPPMPLAYAYDMATLRPTAVPVYSHQQLVLPIPISHSRSHSQPYQDITDSHNHLRSSSQSQFQYRCSDIRMTANEGSSPPVVDGQWGMHDQAHPASTFAPHNSVSYQSVWLRT
ncbi:uncharacterized protein BT62DRAFT_685226 [Guyanagaster necrorhizus]|uniref:Cyclin N-terminal domain-containing protein n=1 Tax=Guyanagaster necrorhizus TaxID=856835 RepID=A0A9P7W014_9AGAR|nr:uncharacterized protein BT62DRAFT_685226 [Guyanagaster necrorhizus MCA 3950]KAG7449459.1 hypothetical protein BT62DRAFT_685226 [Guyanagaster necrorhizus MCA 3950]